MKPERLQDLLAAFYPRFPARVISVSVTPVAPPQEDQGSSTEMYRQAFAKNESEHHSLLKWFGLHWCIGASSSGFQQYRYEVRIAYPTQLELALSTKGKSEVFGEGVVLPPRHRFSMHGCVEKVADVFGCGQVIECGDTDPSSLVLPLAARVATRVLWLPHPRRNRRGNWNDLSQEIEALLVERESTVLPRANQRAHHYPLRVFKNGQHTALVGDRDCRAHVSSDGTVSITYYRGR